MEISTNKKRRNDGEYLEGSKGRINHRFGAPIHKILCALGRGISGAAGLEKVKKRGFVGESEGPPIFVDSRGMTPWAATSCC